MHTLFAQLVAMELWVRLYAPHGVLCCAGKRDHKDSSLVSVTGSVTGRVLASIPALVCLFDVLQVVVCRRLG